MNMNLNKIFYMVLLTGLLFSSCNESEDLLTADAKAGGLLDITSNSLNYVVGNPEGPYLMEFYVNNNGGDKINKINLYKSFITTVKYTEMVEGEEVQKDSTFVSNEILDRTIEIAESKYYSTSYTFSELIDGLTVASLNGPAAPLSDSDAEYQIGDKWVFRAETILESGRTVRQAIPVSVSVSTRYAGKYKTIAAEYYRLGVLTYSAADWPAETIIESVDATTYRVVEYLGAEAFSGNEYYFQINDGVITYPDKTPSGEDQTGNDQPFITCQSSPADMVDVHCATSNVVVDDDATGKDRLIMSFGYNTPGSGPRTFYQVLEKIVD